MEIDWCTRHTEWEEGCKYCGPKPTSYSEILEKFKTSVEPQTLPSFYMIRNKDGLFSNGFLIHEFSEDGKHFKSLEEVNEHFINMSNADYLHEFDDCDIIEFSIEERRSTKFELLYKYFSD